MAEIKGCNSCIYQSTKNTKGNSDNSGKKKLCITKNQLKINNKLKFINCVQYIVE